MGKLGSIAVLVLALAFTLGGVALAGETLGRIQAINPTTKQILLDNGSALAVDQGTKIMVEGKEGSLEDLKAGEEVRASFQEKDGKNVATTLDVTESGHGSMGTQGTMGGHGTMGSQGGSSYQGGQSGMGSQGGSSYGSQGSSTSGGQKQ